MHGGADGGRNRCRHAERTAVASIRRGAFVRWSYRTADSLAPRLALKRDDSLHDAWYAGSFDELLSDLFTICPPWAGSALLLERDWGAACHQGLETRWRACGNGRARPGFHGPVWRCHHRDCLLGGRGRDRTRNVFESGETNVAEHP